MNPINYENSLNLYDSMYKQKEEMEIKKRNDQKKKMILFTKCLINAISDSFEKAGFKRYSESFLKPTTYHCMRFKLNFEEELKFFDIISSVEINKDNVDYILRDLLFEYVHDDKVTSISDSRNEKIKRYEEVTSHINRLLRRIKTKKEFTFEFIDKLTSCLSNGVFDDKIFIKQ